MEDVAEYAFDGGGQNLAYTVAASRPERNGVYIRRLSTARVSPLLSGPGHYRKLVIAPRGDQIAFLSDRGSDEEPATLTYCLYYAALSVATTHPALRASQLPEGFAITADVDVQFTPDGNALTVSLAPATQNDVGSAKNRDPEARFDMWQWREPAVLPQGRFDNRAANGLTKTPENYLAVYHIAQHRWLQVGNESTPWTLLADSARHAIGMYPHRLHMWSTTLTAIVDMYLIDAFTGERRLLHRKLAPAMQAPIKERYCGSYITAFSLWACGYVTLSPSGKYALYFENRRWWSVELGTGRRIDLTGALLGETEFPVSTIGSDAHAPLSQNTGTEVAAIAGWTAEDKRVLLYDRYDIWEIDPAGLAAPRNLTMGKGRRQNIVFRFADDGMTYGARSRSQDLLSNSSSPKVLIDVASPLLLTGIDQETMASGLWHLKRGQLPQALLRLDKQVTLIARARQNPQFLVAIQSASEYPDLWTGSQLDQLVRVSNANPQQSEYLWSMAELIRFTTDFGVPLKGILYKPENFEPSKKYPMIVQIYQMKSMGLHEYTSPEPLNRGESPSGFGWPTAVSKGYLVFVPDIWTASAYSGPSALAAVVPAVQRVIDRGFVDVERVGLMGHSFGAFETNFIITQTDMFRCAVSSAGPTDIVSFFGAGPLAGPASIERSQLAMGGSIWDRPFVYMINSPIFYADQGRTPLLMMHNDADVQPPMSQGMEFFTALQRNGKEVYLFNYRGESHGLALYPNRLDWDRRVWEFLDYHLKDGPQPAWMQRVSVTPPRIPGSDGIKAPAAGESGIVR